MSKTLIAGLVIIAIVVSVFFAFKTTETGSVTSSTGNQTSEIKEYSNAYVSLLLPEDWKDMSDTIGPPLWASRDAKGGGPQPRNELMQFTSANYKDCDESGMGCVVADGYWLEIFVRDIASGESYEQALKNIEHAATALGQSYSVITIDGQNAILSDIKTHDSYWWAETYKGGKQFYFRLNTPDEHAPGVKELFLELLGSVQLR